MLLLLLSMGEQVRIENHRAHAILCNPILMLIKIVFETFRKIENRGFKMKESANSAHSFGLRIRKK